MSIASYIKVIGRGRDGARSLDREQAHDLMSQVLDGRVTDLEIGAFALAMRIKGESVAELAGFVDAAAARCITVRTSRSAVVLPSYNGSRRLPNFTALLAMLLAQHDVPVLVHGPAHDATRVTTAAIFRGLGLTCANDGDDVAAAWQRGEPAFMATAALCPPLARLLAVRDVVGLRNSGHTVAKLLAACSGAPTLRVVNHTHPDYATLLAGFLTATGADAILMRGTEGEPVADARRLQRLDAWVGGVARADLSLPAQEGVLLASAPSLQPSNDVATTASTIQSIVSGAMPAPAPIAAQVACLLRVLDALGTPMEELAAHIAAQ
jgi:anthranilate phosphoribosyltransferase